MYNNFRKFTFDIFEEAAEAKPWFGFEQEYTLFETFNSFTKWPLGWPEGGFPPGQGPYYCSLGSTACFGRKVMDMHYKACLDAGINISGTNGEGMPGQWEFQVGPCEGISIGDHVWMARYILMRVTEDLNLVVDFTPKPIKGDWSGQGGHMNFSTLQMREEGGLEEIYKAVDKLKDTHEDHLLVYGQKNEERLTGKHETAHISEFKIGVGDRSASIRIPTLTKRDGMGYFEDRRPASNADPYLVGAVLCSTTILEGKGLDEIRKVYEKWLDIRESVENPD